MSRLPYRNQRLCRVAGRQPWLSPRRTCKKIQIVTIVFSSYSPKAKAGALRPPRKIPCLRISKADYPPPRATLSRLFGYLQGCTGDSVRWFRPCIYNGCINLERRSTKHAEECKRTLERRAQRR